MRNSPDPETPAVQCAIPTVACETPAVAETTTERCELTPSAQVPVPVVDFCDGHDDQPTPTNPGAQVPVPVVDFYWRPGCPFCMMLKRSLKKHSLPIEYHNIWDDPDAAATVRAAAGGNETVPTVGIAGHMLVNPPVRIVEEILAKVTSGELAPRV